jgi:hypothetical protein
MKRKEFIIQYFMLLVSIVLLFSVVIPHHHHDDGMPCYKSLFSANSYCHSQEDSDSHDCGCNGHNVALYTSLFVHIDNSDVHPFLFPLLILFDYINPPEPSLSKLLVDKERAFYIESLHDTWIKAASGLRAPPFMG